VSESRTRARVLALLAVVLTIVATARVVATYGVLTHTSDEPAHLAAGLQKLTFGRYDYELQHPPIARVAVALGPWFAGARSTGSGRMFREGWEILNTGAGYERNLALARMGVLPFFLALCALVWSWARWSGHGAGGATLAVLCLTSAPPVLAHAGLATTDVPFTAAFIAAAYSLVRWLDRPNDVARGAVLGAACGVALCTKFSFLPFFAATASLLAGAWLAARWRAGVRYSIRDAKPVVLPLAAAAAAVVLVCLAAYDFDVGRIRGIPVPAPDLIRGVRDVVEHNSKGHITFLLGTPAAMGHVAFFPIALLVKTPIPMLLLAVIGLAPAFRRWWADRDPRALAPYLVAAGILTSSMPTDINIGVRHVLPIYACVAIGAAAGLAVLWRARGWTPAARGVAVLLGAWLVVNGARAHPDYLAWFNATAGREPGRILVDSDLDWGQDVGRLVDTLRARKITSVSAAVWPIVRLQQLVPGVREIGLGERPTGWVAISESFYRRGPHMIVDGRWVLRPDEYAWLRAHRPVAWAGKSIRLYWIGDP
jgi:hypothetical protein